MTLNLNSLNLTPEWSKSAPGTSLPPKKQPAGAPAPAVKNAGVVRVGRETKGRKGAGVTVISGIPAHPAGLAKLAGQFKRQCGTGGTVKNGVIEIQGEHRDLLVEELKKLGYAVKRSGG
ncbi:MAG: hypothetical protein WC959_07325 [Kiritimatiellales bacterium]